MTGVQTCALPISHNDEDLEDEVDLIHEVHEDTPQDRSDEVDPEGESLLAIKISIGPDQLFPQPSVDTVVKHSSTANALDNIPAAPLITQPPARNAVFSFYRLSPSVNCNCMDS